MTSQLNVDTIVDKAGSGGSNVKMANTSTYVSDGGAVAQNTVQGLCKSWCNFDGQASGAAARDSFNVGSMTDNSTGNYNTNFTNNMSNDDFSGSTDSQDATTRTNVHSSFEGQTTSTLNILHYEGGSATDTNRVGTMAMGDLA